MLYGINTTNQDRIDDGVTEFFSGYSLAYVAYNARFPNFVDWCRVVTCVLVPTGNVSELTANPADPQFATYIDLLGSFVNRAQAFGERPRRTDTECQNEKQSFVGAWGFGDPTR